MQANNTTLKNVGVIKEGQTDVTCTQMSVKYKVLDHNLRFEPVNVFYWFCSFKFKRNQCDDLKRIPFF